MPMEVKAQTTSLPMVASEVSVFWPSNAEVLARPQVIWSASYHAF